MVNANEFICGTYVRKHPPYMLIKCIAFSVQLNWYICGTSKAVTCQVDVVVSCVLAHIHQCSFHMPIKSEASVTYIYNVTAIFVQ